MRCCRRPPESVTGGAGRGKVVLLSDAKAKNYMKNRQVRHESGSLGPLPAVHLRGLVSMQAELSRLALGRYEKQPAEGKASFPRPACCAFANRDWWFCRRNQPQGELIGRASEDKPCFIYTRVPLQSGAGSQGASVLLTGCKSL